MKSEVESLEPTRVKLSVEVPFDELKPSLDRAYREIADQVTVPGFRKGKVPPRIIDQRFGRGMVIQEAVNDALPGFYAQALTENDLVPLGQPELELTNVPDGDSGELSFVAELDVRPQIQLPDFSTLEVSVDDVEVSDEDVEEELTRLRQRFGALKEVDRPAADGDFVTLDLSASIGEEEIESVSGQPYQIGSGVMLDGLDEALSGLSAGESTSFEAPLAGGEHAGEQALIRVALQAVKERDLPEADDDFAQLASEFDTMEELRGDLREQVLTTKRFEQGLQAREKVMDALLEATDIPLPQRVIDAEVDQHMQSGDHEGHDDEGHREEVAEQARKALATQLLLDVIVEKNEVQVGQPELVEYLIANAQRYGMDPQTFASAVEEAGQIEAMVSEVARRKGLAVVLEAATIKDASGEIVDLDALFPGAKADRDDEPEAPAADAAEPAADDDQQPAGEGEPADGESADATK